MNLGTSLQKLFATVLVSILALAFTPGCGDQAAGGAGEVDNTRRAQSVAPAWEVGDEFIIKAIYRGINAKVPESLARALGDTELGNGELTGAIAGENWSTPLFWRYEIMQSDWVPEQDSSFYKFSLLRGIARPVTIIRASLPRELNAREVVDGLQPVAYIVVREADWRVRSVHYNYRVRGQYKSQTLEMPARGEGVDVGADEDYFLVPYLMPAFPLPIGDYDVEYGGGKLMAVGRDIDDSSAVRVDFMNGLDRGTISQKWSVGAPWFDFSYTHNRRAWRLSMAQVRERLVEMGHGTMSHSESALSPERISERFRRPINVGADLFLRAGEFRGEAADGFKPWAGYWWSMKGGATVLGWDSYASTPSWPMKEKLSEVSTRIEELRKEIFELRKKKEDHSEQREKYNEARREREILVNDFYHGKDGLEAQLRNGDLEVKDIERYSPLDKWSLYRMGERGGRKPFEAASWELLNQYNPAGPNWWGHCNGWAAASILINEPTESRTVTTMHPTSNGEVDITFRAGDLKALASEAYFSTYSLFYGQRYNGEEQDADDLHPDVFHRLITHYLGREKFPLVFDTSWNEEVWNFPAWRYEMEIKRSELTTDDGLQIWEVSVEMDYTNDAVDHMHVDVGDPRSLHKSYTYELFTDERGKVVRGKWTGASIKDHPDFAWVPYANDAGRWGSSENPFVEADLLDNIIDVREWAPEICRRDSECDAGLRCANETGECVPDGRCKHDDDCETGTACNTDSGECVARTDQPGDGGNDDVDTPPVASCIEDAFEGNHDRATAATMTATEEPVSLALCSGHQDWFRVQLKSADTLEVSVEFDAMLADVDLELVDDLGRRLDLSAGRGPVEKVTHVASGDYAVYFRTYTYGGEGEAPYKLSINHVPAERPTDVIDEPERPSDDIDEPEQPGGDTPVEDPVEDPTPSCADDALGGGNADNAGELLPGNTHSGAICGGNDDWFRVEAQGTMTVTLNFTNTMGDLDLKVFDADQQIVDASETLMDEEKVVVRGASGTYFIQVFGYGGDENDYALTVSVEAPAATE